MADIVTTGASVLDRALRDAELKRAAARLGSARTVKLGGVWGSASALVAAATARITGRVVLFIAPHLDDADEVADDIEILTGSPAHLLPAWEVDLGTEHANDEVAGERARVCNLLLRMKQGGGGPASLPGGGVKPANKKTRPRLPRSGTSGGLASPPYGEANRGASTGASAGAPAGPAERVEVIVAPVMALLQPVPSKDTLAAGRLTLRKGQTLALDSLLAWLVEAKFDHVDQVDQQGEFAHRGGIVDIFPPGVSQAVRLEFFGDEIDSIRRFDLDSQRSVDELPEYDLAGAPQAAEDGGTSFLDYLPDDAIVCMVEPNEVMDLAHQLFQRAREAYLPRTDADGQPVGGLLRLLNPDDVLIGVGRLALLELHTFVPDVHSDTWNLGVRSLERMSLNSAEAIDQLTELAAAADVWVYCENPAEQSRFAEVLATAHPQLAERAHLTLGHLHEGFYWPSAQLVAVGHHEIYHRYAKVRRIRRVRAGRPIDSLLDLHADDYVVHVVHGIAKFEGLRSIDRDGRSEEFLSLRFADNAILHVPAANINLVQKYIGSGRLRPNLSKLGGTSWSKQKARVAEAVKDLAAEMLRVQAMRQASPGLSYPLATDWQRQFTDEFLYTETEDQLASMGQIAQDMVAARPMDRLLCGDVGYGKTELAMRAAFKVVEAGRQAAVLVPTTVLAAQHFRTFTERFADFPFTIEMISRLRKPQEQKDILARLAGGQVDVLIGTHRLLSHDVRFKDLGLVVIDEEQRFGVEHKERLKTLRAEVDVLTMTATPIPRTLHMALLGLRDISSLATPPMDRRSIHTEVCHYDDRLIRSVILRELNRKGQVFFVHNRVMDIEIIAAHLRALVPEARLDIAHGQMGEGELETAMLRVVSQKTDVLLCTTIIESGLDIPTANTIIIHNADRFGLAELHQLRGRVGRYKHRAYCYLLLPQERPVSSEAAKRLKAIEEFSDLGAGFQIAMRDLEIRGAGNILGKEQSGHIATVGYELYCQFLEQAVAHLKGEAPPPRSDVHIELGVDSFVPRSYVPSDRQRMEIYRRMVKCASPQELTQLEADLVDAYGAIPPAMRMMIDLAEVRVRASHCGVESIIKIEPDLVFTVRDFGRARCLFDGAVGSVRLPDERTVHWRLPPAFREMPELVNVLLKRLRQACA